MENKIKHKKEVNKCNTEVLKQIDSQIFEANRR
jgi:hypothetical protein